MKVEEIKKFAKSQPFRPFGIRLNNGAQYTFQEPREIGAPKDWHIIIHFGECDADLIDTASIVEVFGR